MRQGLLQLHANDGWVAVYGMLWVDKFELYEPNMKTLKEQVRKYSPVFEQECKSIGNYSVSMGFIASKRSIYNSTNTPH